MLRSPGRNTTAVVMAMALLTATAAIIAYGGSAQGAAGSASGAGLIAAPNDLNHHPGPPRPTRPGGAPVTRPPATTPATTPAPSTTAPAGTGINPPAGSRPVGWGRVVRGTQTYTCAAGTFVGTASTPEAQLAGSIGRIHHFAGPSWQSTIDGSTVTATKTSSSTVTGSIPELLLTVNSHSGNGILTDVAYIQRLGTSGGAAPTTPCTDGDTVAVAYHATYVFWAAGR